MLRKRSDTLRRNHLRTETEGLSRRAFLQRSGLATVGALSAAGLGSGMLRPAEAQRGPVTPPEIELKKTICPFCAVGCSIWAEVQDGVWIGQEPVFESPVNMGTHCAKGAATREMAIGERRLKYPTKLVGGKWTRISWDQAIEEIGEKLLQIRAETGPEAVYWCGSAKFSNEAAYLVRKFASMWGTNNTDNQARICHSTTVSGVAEMYGYGAMTNSFNDIHNSKSIFLLGGNPAEAHPVSMLHLLKAKEQGAKLIVVDPRYTRTAAHATEFVRIRAGTDIAFLLGLMWHVLQNGWEDREYIDPPRLRLRRAARGGRALSARRGGQHHRRACRPERAGGADAGGEPAEHAHLVHGPHPVACRIEQDAGGGRLPARHGQHRQDRRRRQHLPRPRQHPGLHRHRPDVAHAPGLLRPGPGRLEALGARLGRGL